jgi:CheY-like chemotaxis protein
VPTTLLAIDDSITMRKVLELTFAGEDFRVVTADSADAALAKMRAERPVIVLCDVTLDGVGGYGLCAKIKADNPAVSVVLMASKQQPYDSQKGGQARADDFIEKPFDTQQLIEKVKRLSQRPAGQEASPPVRNAPSPPAQPPAAPARQPAGTVPMGVATGRPPGPPPAPGARPAASGIGRGTLLGIPPAGVDLPPRETFPGPPPARPAQPGSPPAPQQASASQGSAVALASPPPVAHASPAAASVASGAVATNGQLATQLTSLGLTEAQVTAVLALSREVIEKVVWEVVPVLAETIIQEEIKRLTHE